MGERVSAYLGIQQKCESQRALDSNYCLEISFFPLSRLLPFYCPHYISFVFSRFCLSATCSWWWREKRERERSGLFELVRSLSLFFSGVEWRGEEREAANMAVTFGETTRVRSWGRENFTSFESRPWSFDMRHKYTMTELAWLIMTWIKRLLFFKLIKSPALKTTHLTFEGLKPNTGSHFSEKTYTKILTSY